jgi:UrcA family protein
MPSKTLITVLAATALGFAAVSPAAAADPDIVSVRVPIADLNLHSGAGAAAALYRIRAAARTICGADSGRLPLARAALQSACVKSTVDRAVARLDAPMVTALNAGRRARIVAASR